MRTLNIRLAVILLVVSVVFGVGVYLLNGYQITKNANMFLKQADTEKEQAKKAATEKNSWLRGKSLVNESQCLEWYIRLLPDNVEVRKRLGMLYAEWSHEAEPKNQARLRGRALALLEATVSMDPDPNQNDARRQLVKMALGMRRYQDAKDHLGVLLKESPKDPELLELLAQSQLQMGNNEAAAASLRKAIESGPEQVTAYFTLASLLRSNLSQPEEADKVMKTLVEANPKSSRAHFLRGTYLNAIGRRDEALQEAATALKLDPDDLDILGLAAVCNLVKKDFDEARRCATHGIEQHPDAVSLYLILAQIELRRQRREGPRYVGTGTQGHQTRH